MYLCSRVAIVLQVSRNSIKWIEQTFRNTNCALVLRQQFITNANGEHSSIPNAQDTRIAGIIEDIGSQTSHKIQRCMGCGATLQSINPTSPGYVQQTVINKYSDGRIKTIPNTPMIDTIPAGVKQEVLTNQYAPRTRVLICQLCFQVQHYKRRQNVSDIMEDSRSEVSALPLQSKSKLPTRSLSLGETNNVSHSAELIERIVYAIRPGSLILHLVDVTDFEASLVPELHEACRKKHLDILWIVNKIDCLPEESRNSDKLLQWMRRYSRQMKNTPMDDIVFVSAITGYNFPLMEKMMHSHTNENDAKYIYVVGRVNVGKSTLVNRFLHFIGYKHLGTLNLRHRSGGITQSSLPGTTLDFIPFSLPKGFKLIDTPGIPSKNQMSSILTNDFDINHVVNQSTIKPTIFKLKAGMSLLMGGLARIDLVQGHSVVVGCFVPKHITLQLCPTAVAIEFVQQKIGSQLRPPATNEGIANLPPFKKHRIQLYVEDSCDDISIAGLGWLNIKGENGNKEFYVWVPDGVHVFRRPELPVKLNYKNAIHSTGSIVDKARGPKHLKRIQKERAHEKLGS